MGEAVARLRFGPFELDPRSGELRKDGELVHLPPQPFKVLLLLARRSGDVVTRHEIREQLWSHATFVDFDQGLNFCIRQIREALGDDAGAPQYVETLPRRGYRFLRPVDSPDATPAPASTTRLLVLPFRMLRPDPDIEFLAFSLPDAIINSLSGLESLIIRSSLAAARFAGLPVDPKTIAAEADVDVVLAGSLVRSGEQLRVSTQLTEVPAGTLLWSRTWQVSLGDLFQVEDELASRVVESLALPLTERERRRFGRDVPCTGKAYELYLRGNQLSQDPKQWNAALELYTRTTAEDPQFAPAWARLGRIYHVTGKYLESGGADSFERAEAAFKTALAINPDLPLAHKLYAQLEVDLGRALDAMVRLLERARSADADVCAGLVSACRYCGLLDASLAAHERARRLEPRIRTSVVHTWFLRGDWEKMAALRLEDNPYVCAMALAALGRGDEAAAALKSLEEKTQTRFRDFMVAARTLIEGRRDESVEAVQRIVASNFRDPEGLFYLARHLAHLGETAPALRLLRRAIEGGFFCFPAMNGDKWLAPLRRTPEGAALLRAAHARHLEAEEAFARRDGAALLGIAHQAMPPARDAKPRMLPSRKSPPLRSRLP
ncbi:MAG TPA: winged helix-turn-helix domain-containing protein [Vicinamibacterales bacterium]|nr:winged helix-turn-helix domain-containing protein [Vicinamibacterales bacterium]